MRLGAASFWLGNTYKETNWGRVVRDIRLLLAQLAMLLLLVSLAHCIGDFSPGLAEVQVPCREEQKEARFQISDRQNNARRRIECSFRIPT
ncbi:MAG: hypothetical protein M2R45_04351 [Verrucomicrobia subdivision 3 bacterium]|nr:hypothetical protein [Limisphaerales bacterium]MCS1416055.1 hypothetical protein [Limisphaerales bacterium]